MIAEPEIIRNDWPTQDEPEGGRFPTQDEPESNQGGQGTLRVNASITWSSEFSSRRIIVPRANIISARRLETPTLPPSLPVIGRRTMLAVISARAAYGARIANTTCMFGERRKPDPRGRPGYLRVDTVHQGDTETSKGLYHINAVDTVTQWEVVGCCETISEAHLKSVLEAVLHQFPFRVRGFHSDNGSEFLNYRVARLLEKMRVEEFTKSRAHRTTDNALVEGKNGAVVRKHIGHEPIAAEHAEKFQRFYAADFNPYLNYHRPCGFATVETASNGKRRRRYRLADYRTPCEKLLSLDAVESCLKPGITVAFLEQQGRRISDTECALRMQQRKRKLLDECRSRR